MLVVVLLLYIDETKIKIINYRYFTRKQAGVVDANKLKLKTSVT